MLHGLLPEIRHLEVLDAVLKLLAIDAVPRIVDVENNELRLERRLVIPHPPFVVVKFDVPRRMLSAIALVLYTGTPLDTSSCFPNRKEIALAMLVALGDHSRLFPRALRRHYLPIIREDILGDPDFGPDVVIEHVARFHRLGLLREIAEIVPPEKWIWAIIPRLSQFGREIHEFVLRACAIAGENGSIPRDSLPQIFAT
jgi:hypothetical protein